MFPISNTIIAAFWTDLNANDNQAVVLFRQTNDIAILDLANADIAANFPQFPGFQATWAFIATWYNMPYCCDCSQNSHVCARSTNHIIKTFV